MMMRWSGLSMVLLAFATVCGAQSIPEQVEQNRNEIRQVKRQVFELEGQQSSQRGPRGERGPVGPPGPKGEKGEPGEKGDPMTVEQISLGVGHAWFLNSEDKRIAYIGTSRVGGGFAQFFNSSGEDVVYLGSDADQKGLLLLKNGSISVDGEQIHDYAEVFDLATRQGVSPGTVMAVAGEGPDLAPASTPYDPRVVGVISGAGGLSHGMRIGSRADGTTDLPLAVAGQVLVRVCLEGGAISPGDLLVASSRAGVAMRAEDRLRAFGAVVGKALETFKGEDGAGEGLVRMLVMTR